MADKVKIAVFVSGGGTNLAALIKACEDNIITSGEISLVVSNKADAYALTRAREKNIEAVALVKTKKESTSEYEAKLLKLLEEKEIEVIVLAGYLRILSENFVKQYPERIINVHPSLIPNFCGDGFYGLKVHEAVLAAGVPETGATVHFVNEITDGGKILFQKKVAVHEGDTPEVLQRRVMEEAEWIILPKACEEVCAGILSGRNR